MIAEQLRPLVVPLADLNLDPANARVHGEKNLAAISASLAQFGQRKPIVVQKQGMVVRAGNGTVTAARALGWTEIAAVVIDDDNATAAQFAIADNRTAELAEWDPDVLVTLLVMGWRQGDKPEHDGVHEHDSVWEIDWEGKQRVVGNAHPTQKPIEVFLRPMRKHTVVGAIVFEPFSGSGSQLIAAEVSGRRCRAMEISPPFVDVAVQRWQVATGRQATLAGDGRTFDQVAADRAGEAPGSPVVPPSGADSRA